MKQLTLPSHYEGVEKVLKKKGDVQTRLMEFVHPVEDVEQEIAEVLAQMGASGKLVLLLGAPGSGKSTFVQSLAWRKHINLAQPVHLEATDYSQQRLLPELVEDIREVAEDAADPSEGSRTCVVIDYLEDLEGQRREDIQSFFRTLNGILRQSSILIIWPVTDREDAEEMRSHASRVSGTVFQRGKEVIEFSGPPVDDFPNISRQTISVLNDGVTPEEFNITPDDLDVVLEEVREKKGSNLTIRDYLEGVYDRWKEVSNAIDKIRNRIPRQTEIWFAFGYPEAEGVVSQFVRKTKRTEQAWTALHPKLYEYIHDTQRAADWNPKRLQLAVGGALTTRIFYIPTNALVSICAAYASQIWGKVASDAAVPDSWFRRSYAVERLRNVPMYRQLRRDEPKMGMRRSGTAAEAIDKAEGPFESISSWTSGSGAGSDSGLNEALAEALSDALGGSFNVVPESPHPWIPNITPDVRVDTPAPDEKHICIELSYTTRSQPYVVAEYVLNKLDRYMRQLEHIVSESQ